MVYLPEFLLYDLNNVEITDLMTEWLKEKWGDWGESDLRLYLNVNFNKKHGGTEI